MAIQINIRKGSLFIFQKNLLPHSLCYSTKAHGKQNTKKNPVGQIESIGNSISAKGFLRSIKSYSPPLDAAKKVRNICDKLQMSNAPGYTMRDLEEKFTFLDACYKQFNHCVPNSQVHEINSIGDVIAFYETPVDTTVPFDALKNLDLPENLHIQYDYVRFHPDTDTKFNGLTAFPKSSTLVTGLKYRGKYAGYEAKRSWP